MSDPKFVEKVRSALELEGHKVPDSSSFYSKYVNKPIPTNTPTKDSSFTPYQEIRDVGRNTEDVTRSLFPRLAEAQVPDYSEGIMPGLKTEGTNIVKGILDVASIPGRALSTGVNVGYDKVRGLPSNDLQQLSKLESDNIVEDIARSPFSIMPGIGQIGSGSKLAQGLGKLVSKTPGVQILTKPIPRAIGKGLESTAENVLIGRAENIASDRDISGGLGKDLIFGSLAGIVPGAGKFVKEKNISDIVDVAQKGLEKIPDQSMQTFMKNISDREALESVLGTRLDDMFERAKADGLSVGNLPKDMVGRYKKYNEILEKRGIGSHLPEYTKLQDKKTPIVSIADLLTGGIGAIIDPSLGVLGYGMKKSANILSDKSPFLEANIVNPLAQNLITPQLYKALTREKISDQPGKRD